MRLRLIRHATLIVELGASTYLVDPMLAPAEAGDPVPNTANPRRNPLVELPIPQDEFEDTLDVLAGVFVTHLHSDHWDEAAVKELNKDLPIFCQPNDTDRIREAGFTAVMPIKESGVEWEGLNISLTGGRHGTGEMAKRNGPVSGFVIKSRSEPSLYIAGDTLWCPEVESALETHQPDVIVVNAGAAQFIDSDPVTMEAEDVIQVARAAPQGRVVAVHMESFNHCLLTRAELARELEEAGISDRVVIPADGETLGF